MKQFLPLFLISLLLLVSCEKKNGIEKEDIPKQEEKEEEKETDDEVSIITMEGLTMNATLHNVIDITVTAEHSKGIQYIAIFANNHMLTTVSEPSLSFSWNTFEFEDGDYDMKILVLDSLGNKNEVNTKVVLENTLIAIDKSLLVYGGTASYYITDSAGKLLSSAFFTRAEINGVGRKNINPKETFYGKKVNLVRVSKPELPNVHAFVEYLVDLDRGEYLNYKNLENMKHPDEGLHYIPFSVKNLTDYDFATLSTNRSGNFSFPSSPGADFLLPYFNPYTKVFFQIEREGQARYAFFDIDEKKAEFEFDAELAQRHSLKKTITFPGSIDNAYLYVTGDAFKGYTEGYVLAEKRFSGSSVDVFYPDTLIHGHSGILGFTKNGVDFYHRYYGHFPERVEFSDMNATVKKGSLSNFEADFSGKFDYYSASFANKEFTGLSNDGYIEVFVYAPKGQNKFSFPDIIEETDIPGFNLNDFKEASLQLYDYNGKSRASDHFNLISNLVKPADVPYFITGSISMK